MSQSEIAHLRQQIATTCEAMYRGLYEYAITGKHDFINAKYRQLGEQHERLAHFIGSDAALDMVSRMINEAAVALQQTMRFDA